jgi:hypothetical protein
VRDGGACGTERMSGEGLRSDPEEPSRWIVGECEKVDVCNHLSLWIVRE